MANRAEVFELVRKYLPDQKLGGKGITLDFLREELRQKTNLSESEISGKKGTENSGKPTKNMEASKTSSRKEKEVKDLPEKAKTSKNPPKKEKEEKKEKVPSVPQKGPKKTTKKEIPPKKELTLKPTTLLPHSRVSLNDLWDNHNYRGPTLTKEKFLKEIEDLGTPPTLPGDFNWDALWELLIKVYSGRKGRKLVYTLINSIITNKVPSYVSDLEGTPEQFLELFKWAVSLVSKDKNYIEEELPDPIHHRTNLSDDVIDAFRTNHFDYAEILLDLLDVELQDPIIVGILARTLEDAFDILEARKRWSTPKDVTNATKAIETVLKKYPLEGLLAAALRDAKITVEMMEKVKNPWVTKFVSKHRKFLEEEESVDLE